MPLVLKAAADFNPETDLEVLGRTAVAPLVCVMSASLPQKTLAEVIAAAKAEPSKWNFAISSLGSAGHLATIDFLRRAGVNIQMVPYRGTQPALQDIMGGNVQLLIDPSFALLPAALDGSRVRALGIATKERSVLAPSVPTMAGRHARLRVPVLVWHLGAEEPAGRHRRPDQRPDPGDHVRSGGGAAVSAPR